MDSLKFLLLIGIGSTSEMVLVGSCVFKVSTKFSDFQVLACSFFRYNLFKQCYYTLCVYVLRLFKFYLDSYQLLWLDFLTLFGKVNNLQAVQNYFLCLFIESILYSIRKNLINFNGTIFACFVLDETPYKKEELNNCKLF